MEFCTHARTQVQGQMGKVFKSGLSKFLKACLPQNLLSPLLNTLSKIMNWPKKLKSLSEIWESNTSLKRRLTYAIKWSAVTNSFTISEGIFTLG